MTDRTPLRVGLIATASIADQRLIPALIRLPDVIFWSVLSRDQSRAQAFAAKHGAKAPQPLHTELKDFLADGELDAVIIASPDMLHADQVIACVEAGKHVFVEKPMATTVADAERIEAAQRAANKQVAVGYHLRFHAGHQRIATLIKEGGLGTLQHMHVSWSYKSSPDDWRNTKDTGRWWSLAAVGTHCLDLVRWLMSPSCGEVVEMRSTTHADSKGGPNDEAAHIFMRFASGATATVVTSMKYTGSRIVELVGSEGGVFCLDTLGPRGTGTITHNRQPVDFVPVDPYEAELADFAATIRDGNAPVNNAGEGLANVKWLDQASTSTR